MFKENPTVMVVEDETLLLQAITKKLKVEGMDILSCSSGKQAVDYLESLDELPDAIWLDYYLKDMNGLAFMQLLKQNSAWQNIPVIVVSNSANPDKVKNMLALGARRYILKAEYRLDEIIAIIRDFITDTENSSGAQPIVTASEQETTTPTPETAAVAPGSSEAAMLDTGISEATPENPSVPDSRS